MKKWCEKVAVLATFLWLLGGASASAEVVEVRPVVIDRDGIIRVEYRSGETLVGRSSDAAPAGVQLLSPGSAIIPVYVWLRKETQLPKKKSDGIYLFKFFTSRVESEKAYEPPFDVLRDLNR